MIKSKPCIVEGCEYPRFAKGYCKFHQYKRENKPKYQNKIIKHLNNKKPTGELVMFQMIWNTREHYSFLSGKPLPSFNVSYFAHVLSKAQGKFPKYKLNPENIVLLTVEEHYLLDHGDLKHRIQYEIDNDCKYEKIYTLYGKLQKEYEAEFRL